MRQHLEAEAGQWSSAAFDEAVAWLSTQARLVEDLADALLAAGDLSGPELLPHATATTAAAAPLPAPPPPLPPTAEAAAPWIPGEPLPGADTSGVRRIHAQADPTGDPPVR